MVHASFTVACYAVLGAVPRHLSYSKETFSARSGLYVMEFLAMGSMKNPKLPSLWLWLLIAPQKLMIRPYC